jgi:effector-binding domain-containing protein
MGPWEIIIQLIVMAKYGGVSYYFGERNRENWYQYELEYQNIEGFEFKDLPKGNTANNYGQYQGSMSNHDKVYENVIEVLTNNGIISTNSLKD